MFGFFVAAFNDNDAYIPERWALESIAILEENMVVAGLIHRDFENEVRQFGDVVNTRKPSEFVSKRKSLKDSVTVQDAEATNVRVPLDQHLHVSFNIYDGEMSKSFKDLASEYLHPAMIAQARALDRIVLGQYPKFLGNSAGKLGGLNSANARQMILDTRLVMNVNKVPDGPGMRNLIWTPYSETAALNTEIFLTADKVGDQGTALREASLGRKLGFDHYMSQNMGFVDASQADSLTGAVNNTNGYPAGTATLAIDGYSGTIAVGSWVTVAGEMKPHFVTAKSENTSGNTVSITLDSGLATSVVDNATVTVYKPAQVNHTGGYDAGYAKYIDLGSITATKIPQVGQMVSFGTGTSRRDYTIIDVTSSSTTTASIMLDRPLDLAVAHNAPAFMGPAGNFNLAFNRNALSLVVRPLAQPLVTGVNAAVVNYKGLSMRAVLSYDPKAQAHMITLDFLCGIAVLDVDRGAVLLG